MLLYTGPTITVIALLLGAFFLSLKTTGDLNERVTRRRADWAGSAAAVTVGFVIWSHATLGGGFVPNPLDALAVLAVIAAAWAAEAGYQGWTFAAAVPGHGERDGLLDRRLGLRVLDQHGLQPHHRQLAAGSRFPAGDDRGGRRVFSSVLVYQGWTFHVFRARLRSPGSSTTSDQTGPTPQSAQVET